MKQKSPLLTIIPAAFAVLWIVFRMGTKRPASSSMGQIVVEFFPVILATGVALFLRWSNERQRLGVLLSLVFPGAGHLWFRHRERGLLFALTLLPLFVAGMALAGFANISPFDRHPIWGMAQAPGGVITALAWLATSSVTISWDNPTYGVGCLYTGTACLLNLLVMCDIWDLEGEHSPLKAAPASDAAPTPAASASGSEAAS